MKRLLIVLCMVLPMLASAQQNYQIKNVVGDVTLRHNNETNWVKVKALMYVDLDDILNVKKGGSVTIVEKSTGRVFVTKKAGKVSVQNRLVDVENNAQGVFAALNSNVRKSVKKHGCDNRQYGSVGAVTRGCDTCPIPVDIYDSVYAGILYFANSSQSVNEANGIVVEKTYVPEGTLSLTLKNTSDKLLYCNVVLVSELYNKKTNMFRAKSNYEKTPMETNKKVSICYYFDDMDFIPLEPGDKVDLTSFPLVNNGQYLLIASEVNLSSKLLETTFEGKPYLQPFELKNIKIITIENHHELYNEG